MSRAQRSDDLALRNSLAALRMERLQPESWPAAAELLRAHAARRAAPRKSVPEFTLGDHFSEAPPTTTVQLGRRHFPGGWQE